MEVPGGRVRIVDSSNFPAASTIAAALVELDQGAMRELHWHPNNDEWQYYISGQGQMTVFASSGKARTFDYRAGDVGYVPFAMGHYVLNTGEQPLRFLEMFRSPVRRCLAQPVAGADPARARPGPPEPGPVDDGRDHREQGQADHRPVSAAPRSATAATPFFNTKHIRLRRKVAMISSPIGR